MTTYDKIFYYCGLVGIILALAIIAMAGLGIISGGIGAIGKAAFGLVVGIGLFLRGYMAKHRV